MTTRAGIQVESGVRTVRERVAAACQRTGRSPNEVTIVAAAKTMTAAAVVEAANAGISDFGENRVPEALDKMEEVARLGVHPAWHFIGHLQRNKARAAASSFDVVHSMDSERLLEEVERYATRAIECFVQVNVAADASKFGVPPAELSRMVQAAEGCRWVRVTGLMTIGPQLSHPGDSRPYFRALRALAHEFGLPKLSMGMTEDFEVAIEEGATHVRIGRAIFGERKA